MHPCVLSPSPLWRQYISELALGMYNKWTELRVVRGEQQWTSTALRLSLVRVDRDGPAGVEEHHIRRAGNLLDTVRVGGCGRRVPQGVVWL
jgi:hypothetical protein